MATRLDTAVLGPITQIPAHMVRPDVLVCFGEDRDDWAEALHAHGANPTHRHHFRGVEAWCNEQGLTVLAPWGSPAVEAVMWELTSASIERCVLWGTAGLLPRAPLGPGPFAIDPAVSHGVACMPDGTVCRPTMMHGLSSVRAYSTDRFYGASPTSQEPRYGDPTLWPGIRDAPAIVDMETAPFYHHMARFAPEVEYLAVRGVANPVTDLGAMPAGAPDALVRALGAAMEVFG